MKRLLLAVCLFVLSACTHEAKQPRVIVLGFDGLDPSTVDLLASEGKMPNFAKMKKDGAYAPLLSAQPLLSPVIWTTIATGKTPDQHHIGHFVAVNQTTGEQMPVTSRMRATKAIWNILSDHQRDVAVVGWWATWPAEPVRGEIVTDHLAYHFLFEDGLRGSESEGTVYPPELAREIAPLIKRPKDLTANDLAPFIHVSAQELERPMDMRDELSNFRWALATAYTYRDIGLHLWNAKKPNQLMVYIEATDSVAHLFGHLFRAGPLSGELAEQQKRYGSAVEQTYLLADRILGDYIAAMDDATTLVVLSDHGFELGKLPDDPSKTRDMRRVSEEFHRLRGILYLYGRGVRRGVSIEHPSIVDVTPTLLALNGVPAASDMPGRVLSEALAIALPPRINSYETGAKTQLAEKSDPKVDAEVIKNLKSLGYLGATSSPEGDRNLAAILFEEKKYAESAAAYAKLVDKNPTDASLRTSYAGALGALQRYDDALVQLNEAIRLDPIRAEAYHNRAVIHERRGDRASAIRDYLTALRYRSDYEPSRQALERLHINPNPNAPRDEPEQHAKKLADAAAGAARSGDYATAMKLLDDATRIAPRYALIYQYRSNVAYLMGDRQRAIEALRKGLELEPGNALFRENLKRLEH